MHYNKLNNYIYAEFKSDTKLLNSQINDFKKNIINHGKKYAQNQLNAMKALESLSARVKAYKSLGANIDDFIELVPDGISDDLIYLYEAYRYDIQYGVSSDDVKNFRRVHLISLIDFATAYARYNQLNEYLSLWLKLNPSNTADEAFSTKADAVNTFNEDCKKHNTSTGFIRESIKLLNPEFNDNSRIKMTKDYKERKTFIDKFIKKHNIKTKTSLDKAIKEIDETNRSKFR